jgi:hypothetical protein
MAAVPRQGADTIQRRGGRRGKRRARDPRGRHRSAFWHRPPYSSRSQPRAPRARACSRRTSPWLAVQLEQHDARHDEQAVGRVPRARAQLRPPRVMSSPRSRRRAAEHHPLRCGWQDSLREIVRDIARERYCERERRGGEKERTPVGLCSTRPGRTVVAECSTRRRVGRRSGTPWHAYAVRAAASRKEKPLPPPNSSSSADTARRTG